MEVIQVLALLAMLAGGILLLVVFLKKEKGTKDLRPGPTVPPAVRTPAPPVATPSVFRAAATPTPAVIPDAGLNAVSGGAGAAVPGQEQHSIYVNAYRGAIRCPCCDGEYAPGTYCCNICGFYFK